MVEFIFMYTGFVAVIFVVVAFFATLPLSLFVLVGLGLWGWRMLATRVSGAVDAKPLPDPPPIDPAIFVGILSVPRPGVSKPPSTGPTPRIPISARVKRLVRMHDRNTCRNCGVHASAPGVVMHIDHVIPLAEGGTNALSNLQLLCAKCNLAKGKKPGHFEESDVLGTAGELAASDNVA
jgi:hypothetical protein